MAGPRPIVAPPTFDPRQYGLLSVVQMREDPAPDGIGGHWRNGVTWQDTCGMAGTTWDNFCLTAASVPTSGGVPDKTANTNRATFGATPFAVVAELDCDAVGYTQDEIRADAMAALTRVEAFQVEQTFWTGTAAGTANRVYPHLAANSPVTDPSSTILSITLQCAATTVSGSVVLDVTEALQRLEAQMGLCYGGVLTIHVPIILAEDFIRWGLVEFSGGVAKTKLGNLVAFGAGYPGTSPGGVATANVAWMYATGPVFAYRSSPETFRFDQMLNRANNTLKSIVERTYVLGYSCCCTGAVPVSVGGDITGQPLSAF